MCLFRYSCGSQSLSENDLNDENFLIDGPVEEYMTEDKSYRCDINNTVKCRFNGYFWSAPKSCGSAA